MNGSRKNAVGNGGSSFSDKVQRSQRRDTNVSSGQSQEQHLSDQLKQEPKELRSRKNSSSSVSSSFSISALPVVMSTPKRNTRNSEISVNSPNISRSRSNLSMNESLIKKKFHKNYDPDIELRQVNERLSKRNSTSWADQSLLNDEQDEDLQRYAEKLKKTNKNLKLVTDTDVLARRQADIDKGKVKQCYKNYVYTINKTERESYMPRTPNKFIDMSRRAWDGMVRKWKKHIHAWNEPAFDALYASGVDIDCCSDVSSMRTSVDSIDDNVERQDQLLIVEEEEETLQGPRLRKRAISPITYEKENIDEDTMMNVPIECKLRDLHTGLTNDAAALSVGPRKRMRMSQTMK